MSTFIDNSSIEYSCSDNTTINSNNDNSNDNSKSNNDDNKESKMEPLGLLSFAISIISIILNEFLTINDVGKLDTAYCNKKKRDQLLSLLSNAECIAYDHLHLNESFRSIDNMLIWIRRRGIQVLALTVDNKTDSDNPNLTDNGLLGLSSQLKSLTIQTCNNITDTSMIEIGRNCTLLKSLSVSGCNNTADTSMIEIGRNCTALQSLNVSGCNSITDTSMIKIGRNCTIKRYSIW
jgi:hypothetical protein